MQDGNIAHFVEGSKLQNKEIFAGKGCKRKIDTIDTLNAIYEISSTDWVKLKGIGDIVLENGEIIRAELHWYEEPTLGKVEFKFKKEL